MKNKLLRLVILFYFIFSSILASYAEVLQEVIAKEGDTLWGVANFYLKDPKRWPEILKYNKLPSSDPNVILPGMKLRVPIMLIKEHLRAARLIYVLNDVRYRRRKEAEWKKAWVDMDLYNQDGLRTLRRSLAQVKFPSGELLKLDENSLIILRPEKRREEVDLLSGGVRSSKTKILTSSSIVDPRIEPRGPAPDFKTKIKEDKTTLVEVYEGIVDVTAQGRTVTLTKGFGTEVKFRKPPSLPHALPPQPVLAADTTSKMPGTKLTSTGKVTADALQLDIKSPTMMPTPIAKSGDRSKPKAHSKVMGKIVNKYHIQIATSTNFTNLILDEVNKMREKISIIFEKYRLDDGVYYYRLAYVDELGFEGQFSTPIQFTIDTQPPIIEIYPQKEKDIDDKFVHIEGRTEPNVKLTIDGKPVKVADDGSFITAVTPKRGHAKFLLAAKDRAGNVTEQEVTLGESTISKKQYDIRRKLRKRKEKGASLARITMAILSISVILGVVVLILG